MPKIQLLDQATAELIAAGEVVERPASVAKELIENSIDAGARHITVEIQRGGILLLRITDDGCGISYEDVPTAFLRHATSKIRTAADLDEIGTLGFRGEALAATAAVSRVELLTKPREAQVGTRYCIEGGVETVREESGCPDGTTILVRDIFYNTPARMKFLKKDSSEGNAVAAVVDRAALSHPEISFRLIRDGKQTMLTPGDGKTESAVYAVLGREFAKSLLPVNGEQNGITVQGFASRPVNCRQSRAWQFVFLNGRFVRSNTVMAAVEQAYKNSAMVGKFPGFVLALTMPLGTVDVNVHPAKLEIRFSDERRVFDAVYRTVSEALAAGDTRPEIRPQPKKRAEDVFAHMTAEEYRQQTISVREEPKAPDVPSAPVTAPVPRREAPVPTRFESRKTPLFWDDTPESTSGYLEKKVAIEKEAEEELSAARPVTAELRKPSETPPAPEPVSEPEQPAVPLAEEHTLRLIGEAFRTYIVVEYDDSIFLIDKHAAHERILFEQLRTAQQPETQMLLTPVRVPLGHEEYDAVISAAELFARVGFEIDDFGNHTVLVRAVPATLTGEDVSALIIEAADSLLARGSVELERLDRLYHTVACKAATKAGSRSGDAELLTLARRVLENGDIRYCPHGRPVAFEIKRRELEKQFGRIQ